MSGEEELTQSASRRMFKAFPNICYLDRPLAPISPHNLPSFSEPFLVVGERDQILEGRHGAFGCELDVGWGSGDGWSARNFPCLPRSAFALRVTGTHSVG